LQDFLLTDITANELLTIAADIIKVDYLGPATEFPCSFPTLMISLSCLKEGNDSKPINVIFLINTSSPNTFLCDKAMEALGGKPGCNRRQTMDVMIHSEKSIVCYLSPHDKHFSNVNVLGMDFLSKNLLSLSMDYKRKSFQLTVK
jgi:hypothetical protein